VACERSTCASPDPADHELAVFLSADLEDDGSVGLPYVVALGYIEEDSGFSRADPTAEVKVAVPSAPTFCVRRGAPPPHPPAQAADG